MEKFICDKIIVREILDFHEQYYSMPEAYDQFSKFLNSLPDHFLYNDFCGKLDNFMSNKMDGRAYELSRFKNGLIQRMRRYKMDGDWTDLNSKIPKITKAKRIRKERKEKVGEINKKNN